MQCEYISLSEAAKRSPGRPHSATIWRWCRKGVRSRSGTTIKLEHVRVGGKIFTTEGSLSQFFEAVAEADAAHFDREPRQAPPKPATDRQRARSVHRAEQVLHAGGIL